MAWRDRLAVAVGRGPEPNPGPQSHMDNIDRLTEFSGAGEFCQFVNSVINTLPPRIEDAAGVGEPLEPLLSEFRQEAGACFMRLGVVELAVDHGLACGFCAGQRRGPQWCDWPPCPLYAHVARQRALN